MRTDVIQGDLEPPLGLDLTGATLPLPDGVTVTFAMVQANGTKSVHGPGALVDPTIPSAEYTWQLGDLDTVGVYRTQFTLVYPGGAPETFPSDEPFYVVVHPKL